MSSVPPSTNGILHAHTNGDVTVADESEPPPAEAEVETEAEAEAEAETDATEPASASTSASASVPAKQSSASKRRQRKKNLVQNQRMHSSTTLPHTHTHMHTHTHTHTRGPIHVKSAVAHHHHHHHHENVEVDVTGIVVNGSPRSTSSASSAASSPLSQSSSLSLSSIVSSPVTTPPYTSQPHPHAWTTSSMQTSPTTCTTSTNTNTATPSLLHLHSTSQTQQQTQQQSQQQQQAYRFHPHQHMMPMTMPFFHPSFLHPTQHLLLPSAPTTLPMPHPHPHPHPHAIPMSMSMPSVWFPQQQQVRVPSTPPPSQLAFSRSWTSLPPPAMTSPTTATSTSAAASYSPRHHLNNQMTYGMTSPVHNGFTTSTPPTPTHSQIPSPSPTHASSPIPQPLFTTPTKSAPTATSHETPPSITKRSPSSSPPPSIHKLTPQPYDYYCILDFEATCAENDMYYQHEIIEFPVVFVNSRTLQIDYEFHSFVKPSLHPELTPFCTRLTGITQSDVDSAPCLSSVLTSFENFCLTHHFYFPGQRSLQKSHRHTYAATLQGTGAATPPASTSFNTTTVSNRAPHAKSCCFVTDGPWDFISFLEPECSLKQLSCPPIYHHFIDLRQMFSSFYACKRTGIKQMLQKIGLQFQGREHSGLADSRNIARIAIHLLQQGCLLTTNLSIYP